MENPSANLGLLNVNTPLCPSGKPPNTVMYTDVLISLERPISPLSKEAQRASKKVKNHAIYGSGQVPTITSKDDALDTSMMEVGKVPTDPIISRSDDELFGGSKPSFRDIMVRQAMHHDQCPTIDYLDVEVLAEYV
ncbi:hypothetical protein V6N13_006265 [Hibiscus sabdariffa]|uniref:Uncharacterized protein n=1 Tax=Hibiscus sabdariffa TaxID=183260 RepID=A0ABR2ENF8_9ROSI